MRPPPSSGRGTGNSMCWSIIESIAAKEFFDPHSLFTFQLELGRFNVSVRCCEAEVAFTIGFIVAGGLDGGFVLLFGTEDLQELTVQVGECRREGGEAADQVIDARGGLVPVDPAGFCRQLGGMLKIGGIVLR